MSSDRDLLPDQKDLLALRDMACSGRAVIEPSASRSRLTEPFEGVWAKTKKECLDTERPNSRTIIDLSNLIEGKPAPILDRYENHCIIDSIARGNKSTALAATCYEFWEDLTAKRDARKATITLSDIGRSRLKMDGASLLRCER